jgi:hypothetical protein
MPPAPTLAVCATSPEPYLVDRLHELTPETRPGVLDELPGGIRGVVQRGRHRAGARDGLWIARWVFHYDTLP